jgi:hypothetical protein
VRPHSTADIDDPPIASAATLIVLDQNSRNGVAISARRLIRIEVPVAVVTSVAAVVALQYLIWMMMIPGPFRLNFGQYFA